MMAIRPMASIAVCEGEKGETSTFFFLPAHENALNVDQVSPVHLLVYYW